MTNLVAQAFFAPSITECASRDHIHATRLNRDRKHAAALERVDMLRREALRQARDFEKYRQRADAEAWARAALLIGEIK